MRNKPVELRLTSALVFYCEQTDEICTAELLVNSDCVYVEFDKEEIVVSRYVFEDLIEDGTFLLIDELGGNE